MDYFVPNFGVDVDIKDSILNERASSKLVGHEWKFKTPESFEKYRNKAKDIKYNYHPSLDADMKDTISHLTSAEGTLGTWDLPMKVKVEPKE